MNKAGLAGACAVLLALTEAAAAAPPAKKAEGWRNLTTGGPLPPGQVLVRGPSAWNLPEISACPTERATANHLLPPPQRPSRPRFSRPCPEERAGGGR